MADGQPPSWRGGNGTVYPGAPPTGFVQGPEGAWYPPRPPGPPPKAGLSKPMVGLIACGGLFALFLLIGLLGAATGGSKNNTETVTAHAGPPATNPAGADSTAPTRTVGTTEPPGPGATEPADEDETGNVGGAPPPTAVPAAAGTWCRPDPLANVYHPTRLRVIDACRTVSGVVTVVRHEKDGDYHIDIALDPPFASLVNAKNISGQAGALVVEIIPADEPGCTTGQPPKPATGTYDYGVCTGANVVAPKGGDHIQVTGPYVLDTAHGWMEIHPACNINETADIAPTLTMTTPRRRRRPRRPRHHRPARW